MSIPCCYRAKKLARVMVHGNQSEQFKYITQYGRALERWQPGTSVVICKTKDLFKRLYIYLVACKAGLKYCRPIICVDKCHLEGQFGGQLLCGIEQDKNNNMFHIAYAMVQAETWDSWS